MKRPRTPPETEAGFQRAVIQLATALGYLVHHQRPARTAKGWRSAIAGRRGFCDLVLVHPKRGAWFVECKSDSGGLGPGQAEWLEALRACGLRAEVWRPRDFGRIERILKGEAT